jgi:cytoskeletal protein RodZ
MKLKTSVAISLGVSLGLMTLVLLAGLLLPTSVLTKFSKDKSSTTTPASKVADTSDTKAVDKAATQQTTEAQQTTTEQPAAAQPTATGAKPTTTTTTTTTTTGTTTSGGTTSGGGTTAPTTIAPTLTFSGSPTTKQVGLVVFFLGV